MRREELITSIDSLKKIGYAIRIVKRADYPCIVALISNRGIAFHFVKGGTRDSIIVDYYVNGAFVSRVKFEMNGLELTSILKYGREN